MPLSLSKSNRTKFDIDNDHDHEGTPRGTKDEPLSTACSVFDEALFEDRVEIKIKNHDGRSGSCVGVAKRLRVRF